MDRAMSQPLRTPFHGLLSGEPARLLDASTVNLSEPATRGEWIAKGPRVHVLCPAGTTFDAAEALRLQLVDRAPPGVVVDVEIAPSPAGTLSAEDEAGVRLFAAQRAERLAPKPAPDPDAFPWEVPEGGGS